MCSTCGCRKAEEFQAPMTPADDICVACALHDPEYKSNICKGCQEGMGIKKLSQRQAARFTAEGDASKTTSSLNARFFVGVGSDKDLLGKGKFMKYNDAVAKAKQVAEKEGKARVVSTRGLALWTHDGKGLFQAGTTTQEAKKYYRAEDGSVDMDAYANDYMAAEDGFFNAEESFEADYFKESKNLKPLSPSNLSKYFAKKDNNIYIWIEDENGDYGVVGGKLHEGEFGPMDVPVAIPLKADIKKLVGFDGESFEAESKFDKLSDEIAAQYRKKGKSAAEAKRIGQATAAKIGFKKYGKRGMVAKAKRGRTMASEGIMKRRTEIPLAGLTLLALGYIGATRFRNKVTYDCEDCGCKDCEEKKAEGYPEVYDPVQDFLPKYRYPKDSVWSNDYNPADPYRALDYQTVHTDSNTKAKRM